MPYRYAVLWEPGTDHPARPAGLAVEQDGCVLVEARNDLCMPTRYEDPIIVGGIGLHPIVYRPGDEQYFDQVLVDLSRPFIIGEQGVLPQTSESVLIGLLNEKVLRPLRRDHVSLYTTGARKYPVIDRYQRRVYRPEHPSALPAPDTARSVVSDGSLVAA